MISKTAISAIESLKSNGLVPSTEDIIRLNALGLKLEAARKKRPLNSVYFLPRVAAVSPTLFFRQPTVGHEIWMDSVGRFAEKSYQTELAIKAYALSRKAEDLPDPEDPVAVKTAVDAFARLCSDLTRDQLYAALEYVIFGASQVSGEHPESRNDEDRVPDGTDDEDWKFCISLGLLYKGTAVLWGIDRKEMESMTRRQLEDTIRRAAEYHHVEFESEEEELCEDFYTTLDVIEERLKKENRNNG